MPQVAIITRTKNRPLLLKRAISSILRQQFSDYCWVVVNDGGDSEEFLTVLEPVLGLLGGRLVTIHHAQSKGMEAASNAGILASDSCYLVIHDDDDTWEPDFLRRSVEMLEQRPHPLVRGVMTHCTQIDERIEGGCLIEKGRKSYNGDLKNIRLTNYLTENRTPPICFLYDRSVHEEIGLYDVSMDVLGDWDFYLRYFQRYEAVLVREHLANYHIRPATSPSGYGNSVTAGLDKHAFFAQLMWNRLLRADLTAGQAGIGTLAATVQENHVACRRLDLAFALMVPLNEARRDGIEEVVVCGAGDAGRKAAQLARAMSLAVRLVTDRNHSLHGSYCEGIPIVPLEEGVRSGLPCIVASVAFGGEIAAEINRIARAYGLSSPKIYAPVALA